MDMQIVDWNEISYAQAWENQTALFNEIIAAKLSGTSYINRIIFCQHPPVYTIGKNGHDNNMLIGEAILKQIGATYFHIDRGGDITYHGPGQLVVYPILNLDDFGLGLKEYIHLLEEAVILTCADYGVSASRLDKATGVWLDVDSAHPRKICAIGVKCSRFVTMHGLAFNVSTDLSYFNHINPCGFVDKGVTSLKKELGKELNLTEVEERLKKHLSNLFKR